MLSIKELTFSFDPGLVAIFQQLTLSIKKGEFVSVIGPSGSGKSTLFKLITGLKEPCKGEISIDRVGSGSRLGKAGYMPQNDLLLPWSTVFDNVMLPVRISKKDKHASALVIRDWLTRFGLSQFEQAYPHELSGGMRQRVAFLRTIMTGKELLLLDEPFGALDSLTKRNMHAWLLGMWEELQNTVLFITHDLEEAILLSDRIYILRDGKLQEFAVNLPRPRNTDSIYQAEFMEMRKELERLLYDEG
jgi:putative hydroxymethylpyrimidine transport system ATP-binding protein